MPPLFFINVTIPADRVRFSLAHEIGHIVVHQLPTDDMEREADRFAAEFLMPESAVRPDLTMFHSLAWPFSNPSGKSQWLHCSSEPVTLR